ncbi:MAG: hypothetical protein U0Q55_12490 [Vicinamibacterales bacterium]
MSNRHLLVACALGACLCARPAVVLAQHGAEAKPSEHAAPAAKHGETADAKDAGHAAKTEPVKAAEAKAKAPAKPTDSKADPKPEPKADAKSEPVKKGAVVATASEPAEAGAAHGEKAEKVTKPAPKPARADGPRVTVTRVDESTGSAHGSATPAAHSKLEAALDRISERLDDARKDAPRASNAKAANRIRLSWRTTLDWPEELGAAAPEPQMAAPPAAHDAPPDKDHVVLVWE